MEKTWNEKPISQARLFGEINKRVQGKSWALVSAHGRRWREAIEVTEPAHGMGGGRGGGVGYGLPSSIGAALGFKESGRVCVRIIGDGDFLMTSNALVDRGEVPDSVARGCAEQPVLLQRRRAPGAHGASAPTAGREQGHRHPHRRSGAGSGGDRAGTSAWMALDRLRIPISSARHWTKPSRSSRAESQR